MITGGGKMYKQPETFKVECVVCGKIIDAPINTKPHTERGIIKHACNECYNKNPENAKKYMARGTYSPLGTIPVHLKDYKKNTGNIITIEESYDLDISKEQDKTIIAHIKAGDKFIIDKIGRGLFLTGEAKGRSQKIDSECPLGVNINATIDFILDDLNCFCNLKEILKEHNINEDDFKNVIIESLRILRF